MTTLLGNRASNKAQVRMTERLARRLLSAVSSACLLLMTSSVHGVDSPPPLAETQGAPDHPIDISVSSAGVIIDAHSQSLDAVLQAIQPGSGIRFDVSDELKGEPVTASIRATDWPQAIRVLLKPFNTLEVVGADGGLQRVIVIKRATHSPSTRSGQEATTLPTEPLPATVAGPPALPPAAHPPQSEWLSSPNGEKSVSAPPPNWPQSGMDGGEAPADLDLSSPQ